MLETEATDAVSLLDLHAVQISSGDVSATVSFLRGEAAEEPLREPIVHLADAWKPNRVSACPLGHYPRLYCPWAQALQTPCEPVSTP